ncbi:MAG: nickel pincer cofactor biosynthesis protein LarC [Deltaproteobacteria bacterium]|nr:nickel pincer cofactor biosynthesis protein LarC [Deltaproteobacteria bacterium]
MNRTPPPSRCLYLDARSGLAGDMILAALLHAGADIEAVRKAVAAVVGDRVTVRTVPHHSGSLEGLVLDVSAQDETHDRHAGDIIETIRKAGLAERVVDHAAGIFEVLAAAEGKVHGVPADQVHFHEVGALDSISDVVGIAAALEDLGIDSIHASALPMTSGAVQTRHGLMPVPAPATLEVLKGYPVFGVDLPGEFVTPTGAAVCAALVDDPGALPPMRIESIGYGFGTREWPDGRPNCVRAIVGSPGPAVDDTEYEVSANIDDMSPDDVSRLLEALLEAGALDAWVTPVLMKKGRPSWVISAVMSGAARDRVESTFFEESTTIGIRIHALERLKLEYHIDTVTTSVGDVRVKRAYRDGRVVNRSLESDDLRRIAREKGIPLKRVRARVLSEVPPEE